MNVSFFQFILLFCKSITIAALLVTCQQSHGQNTNPASSDSFSIQVIDGDTVFTANIPAVNLFIPREFKSTKEFQKYLRLVRNVKKVYPYAVMAGNILKGIDDTLNTIQSKKEKKEYLDVSEKRLRNRFEEELKQLTVSQGRILIKLVDRETGQTTFHHVKELRGSFQAFFWQALARLFGSSLKTNYDPSGEDKDIEEIILKIQKGEI